MENKWFPKGSLSLPSTTACGSQKRPPPLPPDPLDPSLALSSFPPLSPGLFKSCGPSKPPTASTVEAGALDTVMFDQETTATDSLKQKATVLSLPTDTQFGTFRSRSVGTVTEKYTVVTPKATSPLKTNAAASKPTGALQQPTNVTPDATKSFVSGSSSSVPVQGIKPPRIISRIGQLAKKDLVGAASHKPTDAPPAASKDNFGPSLDKGHRSASLVERIRKTVDRNLKRQGPSVLAELGRPVVSIPEEVFQRGAELHKESIVCYFCGRAPPSNHSADDDGRIILFWKSPISCRVLHKTRQAITSHALSLDNKPWILGGDMNQILHPADDSSSTVTNLDHHMCELRDTLLQLGLFDLRYQGSHHSWTNNQPNAPLATKLDRCLVNNHWINLFPNSVATFMPPQFSDHCPCLTDFSFQLPRAGTKPFKFYNYLTKHPNFAEIIEDAWLQVGDIASDLS